MDVTSTYGFGDKFVEITSANFGVYVDKCRHIVDMHWSVCGQLQIYRRHALKCISTILDLSSTCIRHALICMSTIVDLRPVFIFGHL